VATLLLLATAVSGRGGLLHHTPAATVASMSSAQASPTTATSLSRGSTLNSTPPPTTGNRSPVVRVIQWMNEHGPTSGGATGLVDEAYVLMMNGDCRGALRIAEGKGEDGLIGPLRTLYLGAGSACLAAFEGKAELWPRADAAFEKTTSHAVRLDCESRAVYELLRRLVEAHRAEPSARLVKRLVGRRAPICPRFTKVTPDHGPAEGGYTVLVEGENLPHVVGVNFLEEVGVEHFMKAVSQDGRHVLITIPRAIVAHTPDDYATIWPDGLRYWTDSVVQFRYDPPGTTTRPSTTTTTTTTTTTQATAPTSITTSSPSSS
jgi:hypothetical protein